jgi:predicted ABC-type ATPase
LSWGARFRRSVGRRQQFAGAAEVAAKLKQPLVDQPVSFIFETVFSDPAGDKLQFLQEAVDRGFSLVLCFIGNSGAERSEERVAMRVSQGGHNAPTNKLMARYPRTMLNLKQAVQILPSVLVFDNDDIRHPFRLVAIYQNGNRTF